MSTSEARPRSQPTIDAEPSVVVHPFDSPLEARTLAIGREIFQRVGNGSNPLDRAWWDDRFMAVAMDDPEVKVQLFRFIDVLPALKTPEAVGRHLREYLGEAAAKLPWWMAFGVDLAPTGTIREGWLSAIARRSATHMARRFIAGETPDEALKTVLRLRRQSLAFTADLLGEAVITESEAETYANTCLDLLRGLAPNLGGGRKSRGSIETTEVRSLEPISRSS